MLLLKKFFLQVKKSLCLIVVTCSLYKTEKFTDHSVPPWFMLELRMIKSKFQCLPDS